MPGARPVLQGGVSPAWRRAIETVLLQNFSVSGRVVKRAYKYRFYPTPEQAGLLNRTFRFGALCVQPGAGRAIPGVDPGTGAGHVRGDLPDADRHCGRSLVSEFEDVLGVRPPGREHVADRPRVDLRRVRCAPQPGRERGESSMCRRAGGPSLRRWCQTAPHVVLEATVGETGTLAREGWESPSFRAGRSQALPLRPHGEDLGNNFRKRNEIIEVRGSLGRRPSRRSASSATRCRTPA